MRIQYQMSPAPNSFSSNLSNLYPDDSGSSDSISTKNTITKKPFYFKSSNPSKKLVNTTNQAFNSLQQNQTNSTVEATSHNNDNGETFQENIIQQDLENSNNPSNTKINNKNNYRKAIPTVALDDFDILVKENKYVDKTIYGLRLFKGLGKNLQEKPEEEYINRWVRFFRDSQWEKTSFISMLEFIAGGEKNKEMFDGLEISKPETLRF